jgi:hypothetical protein
MPLIKVYNNDSNIYGLNGHSIFKSVCNSEASWRGTFGHHMRTASAEAVSSYRTFGDEAWSQQSRCSAWCTGQSGATPDSPVNYTGAVSQFPEGGKFRVELPGAPDSPVRQTRAAFGLSFALFI